METFSAYLIIDYSASAVPKTGKDSIWYCHVVRQSGKEHVTALENPSTRHEVHKAVRDLLIRNVELELTTLVGFDFPYSYPAGFADAIQASGAPQWRAVWDELSTLVKDDDRNRNNRFEVAANLNSRITGRQGPFWGCPPSAAGPYLSTKKRGSTRPAELAEYRMTERVRRGPQPVWKLYTAGSVGSQALLGIPMLSALRFDYKLSPVSHVWPFETGMKAIENCEQREWKVLYAEIYPSLIRLKHTDSRVKDSVQVETLAKHFAQLDRTGKLSQLFEGPAGLSDHDRGIIEEEEGWILGIQ